MSIEIEFQIKGGSELSKKLSAMGSKIGGRFLAQALGYAVTPTVREARKLAPRGDRMHRTYKGRLVAPGFLSRNIGKSTFKNKKGTWASASVGAKREAWYGPRLVERGYTATDKNKVKHREVSPRKWLSTAFSNTREEAERRFIHKLREKIDQAARKK